MSIKTDLLEYLSDVGEDDEITKHAISAQMKLIALISSSQYWLTKNEMITTEVKAGNYATAGKWITGIMQEKDTGNEQSIDAIKVDIRKGLLASVSGSIYEACDASPIYYETSDCIYIVPDSLSDKIIIYIPIITITSASLFTDLKLTIDLSELFYLLLAESILSVRLDRYTEDEEDSELTNMLALELNSLKELKMSVMETLGFIQKQKQPYLERGL